MPLLDLRLPGEKTLSSFYDSIAAMTEMLPCPHFNIVVGSDINVTTFDEHCRVDFPFVSHKLRARHGGKDENRERGQLVITIMWVIWDPRWRGVGVSGKEVLKPSLHALKDAPAF
ncbi:hypothetical protein JOQ06_011177, partial [Pogonophryne albipinna]